MISKEDIQEILKGYDKDDLTIATICSHSSLQIFHGARQEGFKTLGICIGRPPGSTMPSHWPSQISSSV